MKNNKLWLASLSALIAIPSAVYVVPVNDHVEAAKVDENTSPEVVFKDVPSNNPYFEIINEMHRLGYISGYPDGTFKPTENISRKHVAALLSRVLPLESVREAKEFKDVPKTHLYYDSIQRVQRAGIMTGDQNGNFNPEASLTRAQIAKVIDLAFDLNVKSNNDFVDIPPTHWANEHVMAVYSNGVMTGYGEYFKPNEKVTRAQYAIFLYNTLNIENNDQTAPADPPLAQPIQGQLTYYSEAELRTTHAMAVTMYIMARQKVTMNEPGVVTDAELYFQDPGIAGELSEQNLLYLKRFVEKGSEIEQILDKWINGDFSDIVWDYIALVTIADADGAAGDLDVFVKKRTKEAEEYYINEVFGKEALKRHKEQY
ncbi:S-layer homology domain-containing protein [Lysinibacillus telephonicus]|uniref:S-layer homology domain-containing protein n=1 Tax=Lysinibacillus telephonicus TaxID=1714840 RepID=UPI003BA26E8E